MTLFDYIYYRIYFFFIKLPGKRYSSEFQTICALSTLQWMNLYFLIQMFFYYKNIDISNIHLIWTLVSMIIIIIFNYIRYSDENNITQLIEKWRDEELKIKRRNGIFTFLYVVISILLCVWSADFVGHYFRSLRLH